MAEKENKVTQLTEKEREEARLRFQSLIQISLKHGSVPVQAQVNEQGKIISVVVYEKKK